MFLSHVIGGKHLSSRELDFTAMVRGATPDVVLTGVELLARGLDEARPGVGDVVVVDVGGATTDVHSVVEIDPEDGSVDAEGLAREVVAGSPVTRTVEGDLGMRWSAGQHRRGSRARRPGGRGRRTPRGPRLPARHGADRDDDEQIAGAAAGLALRRHAGRSRVVVSPEGRVVERSGVDLREVDRSWCSRAARSATGGPGVAERVLTGSLGPGRSDVPGVAGSCPSTPRVVVDADYVLAAVGLLAGRPPGRGRATRPRTLVGPGGPAPEVRAGALGCPP